MSIWTELLFLHGHVTRFSPVAPAAGHRPQANPAEDADRLRELIGCPAASQRRPEEPRGPLLGVRGLT
jgi:hypothetical protein